MVLVHCGELVGDLVDQRVAGEFRRRQDVGNLDGRRRRDPIDPADELLARGQVDREVLEPYRAQARRRLELPHRDAALVHVLFLDLQVEGQPIQRTGCDYEVAEFVECPVKLGVQVQ